MTRRKRANFLDYVPSRNVETTRDDTGALVLLVPKFGRGRLGRWWASLVGRRSILKVHLDELGSRTWDSIDGSRTIAQIAHLIGSTPDGFDRSMYERCSMFLKTLDDAGAIRLAAPGEQ